MRLTSCKKKCGAHLLRILVVSLPLITVATPSFANDSEAGISGGQLTLKKSEHIVMKSEDLFLSKTKVRVDYIFENDSKADVKTTIAFPMPELCLGVSDDGIETPTSFDPDAKDPLAFKVKVNGKPVTVELDRKIRDVKTKSERCYTLTYFWDQTFPAGKTLQVTHTYTPANDGFMVSTGKYLTEYKTEAEWRDLVTELCIEPSLTKKLESLKSESSVAVAWRLRYVLKTGANWKGPIGNFKLTIEKPEAKDLVTLCWTGMKKINPTTFVFEAKNFTPARDLDVMFLNLP